MLHSSRHALGTARPSLAVAGNTLTAVTMATTQTAEGRGGAEKGGQAPSAWQAIGDVAKVLDSNYRKHTPTRLRMLDMFLVFVFSTGVLQVGTGFLAGGVFAMQSGSWSGSESV